MGAEVAWEMMHASQRFSLAVGRGVAIHYYYRDGVSFGIHVNIIWRQKGADAVHSFVDEYELETAQSASQLIIMIRVCQPAPTTTCP